MILVKLCLLMLFISNSGGSESSSDSSDSPKKFVPYPGVSGGVLLEIGEGRGAAAASASPQNSPNEYESFFDNKGNPSNPKEEKKKMYNELTPQEKRKRAIELLEIRRLRIAQLRAQYEQERQEEEEMQMMMQQEEQEEEEEMEAHDALHENFEEIPSPRQLQLQLLQDYLSEWQRYEPQEYYAPPSFYSPYTAPFCNCLPNDQDTEETPQDILLPRTIVGSEYRAPLHQPAQPAQHPIPNRRYMKPINRSRRSADYYHVDDDDDEEDDYWYYEGPKNRVLENVNLGYRAKEHYAQTIPYLIRPLHYGKIYTGQKNYYRKFGYGADFNLPYDLHAFNRKPKYYYRTRYYH
jgi:hypothetical protein